MTKVLGIDYGKRKIGLALSSTALAEPYKVIIIGSQQDAIDKAAGVVKAEAVEEVVVGVSEGKMAEETKEFAKSLEKALKLPVALQDETLSTREAQRLSIEANIPRKKRRELEDSYSAALILQNYLDTKI